MFLPFVQMTLHQPSLKYHFAIIVDLLYITILKYTCVGVNVLRRVVLVIHYHLVSCGSS